MEVIIREHPGSEDTEALPGVRDEISRIVDSLRHLAFELHPRVLDAEALKASLRFLLERSREHGVEGELEDRLVATLPTQVCLTVYRVAQEALRNAQRHAVASSVTISLSDRAGGMVIRIHDDGRGFDVGAPQGASGEHLGIISMQERAEILGGWLQVESEPGVGTMVECWLPLSETVRAPSTGVHPDQEPSAETSHVRTGNERSASVPELNDLSPREREIADLLSLGHTNSEISAILHLSIRTVEHHRSRVFRKMNVRSRAGLVQALRDRRPDLS